RIRIPGRHSFAACGRSLYDRDHRTSKRAEADLRRLGFLNVKVLADGRMIIPVGALGDQKLYLLRKHGAKVEQQAVLPVFFVPMTRKPGREDRPLSLVERPSRSKTKSIQPVHTRV